MRLIRRNQLGYSTCVYKNLQNRTSPTAIPCSPTSSAASARSHAELEMTILHGRRSMRDVSRSDMGFGSSWIALELLENTSPTRKRGTPPGDSAIQL